MIKVLFIVGRYYENFDHEFGGTTREYHALVNAFKESKEFKFDVYVNKNFEITKLKMRDYDVIHVDDNKTIKEMLKEGIHPDIIGPTTRSPTKNEVRKKEWEQEGFNVDDYYKSIVVRNTHTEERLSHWDKIRFISLGVDTDKIGETKKTKRWVLWAGDVVREAKNYQMFIDTMKITKLPKEYNWKVMSSYKLQDYLEVLKNTALVINTSLNETFCFAMFEANASHVPTIYQKGLHNPKGHKKKLEFHQDKPIQIEYTPEVYRDKILELLNDEDKLRVEQIKAREYACKYGSYENIRKTFGKIYKEVYNDKL